MVTNLEFQASNIEIEIVLEFTYQIMKCVGPKREGVSVEWRRLHIQEIYYLFFTQNIIRMTKSGRLRWAGIVYGRRKRCVQGFGEETLEKRTIWDTKG
jgi:hypothetical protein